MSVIKSMRKLSTMEFYKNAIRMRKNLTDWLLRDFGTKRNKRSIRQVIKGIDESDQRIIDNIFAQYGRGSNSTYDSEYPDWFVNYERDVITKLMHDLIENITSANSIYATRIFEFDLRREYQDKAICNCYCLYQELQYIASIFRTDLNSLTDFLNDVEKEIDLLKGWRQSDNKNRTKAEE